MITALAYSADSAYYGGYGYGGYGFGWFDPTYVFVIIGLIITLIASANVNATFKKFNKKLSKRGITAAMTARRILDANGLRDIRIERVSGNLTDHYSPKENVIRLSDSTYDSSSIAALGVAAHECGHALQHQAGYAPIRLRNSMVPVVNICSRLAIPIILLGIILSATNLAMFGVVLYCAVFAFQLVTLPTETNASRRAIETLYSMGILDNEELKGTKKVLNAAALTYFASAAATALQILRLFLIASGNRRRD